MPICSRLAGRQIDQTFGIMDVKGEWQRGCGGCGAGTEMCAGHRSTRQAAACEQRWVARYSSSSSGTVDLYGMQRGLSKRLCLTAAVSIVTAIVSAAGATATAAQHAACGSSAACSA
jgi:hypothetical protein